MNKWTCCLLVFSICLSCKSKKNNNDQESWFAVLPYLQSQVKQVDTSLHRIIKVETVDSTADTTFIPREEFRKYAQDFLDIPDISTGDKRDDYEESKMYDDVLNNVILSYTANKPGEEIRREDVTLTPGPSGGTSEVRTIFINRIQNNGGNTVEKNMLWQVDKKFQIVTKTQPSAGPGKVKKLEVIWNDFAK